MTVLTSILMIFITLILCVVCLSHPSLDNVKLPRSESSGRCSKVVQGKEAAPKLPAAHRQFAKAVEPAMADLTMPSS
jgi:hypothetical protein